MTQKDLYIASKPRYEILDGLRGMAALMAVFFHCLETYNGQIGTQIINHGYVKSAAWCDFLGRLSYPLYITHYPLMYMQMAWVERNAAAPPLVYAHRTEHQCCACLGIHGVVIPQTL